VDGVWTWRRKGHNATLDAVAEVVRAYRVPAVRTDQHAAQPILEGLARRRVHAVYEPWTNQTKADAFAVVKVALNTSAIELPDDAALVEELCSLEARPTPSGLTRIAAAGRGRDDRAVALAAAVVQLRRRGPSADDIKRMVEDNDALRATAGSRVRTFGALSPGRLPISPPGRYLTQRWSPRRRSFAAGRVGATSAGRTYKRPPRRRSRTGRRADAVMTGPPKIGRAARPGAAPDV